MRIAEGELPMNPLLTAARLVTNKDTDRALLQAYATTKDEAAFAELVRQHAGMVHRVATTICAAEGDDVTQATFTLLAQRAAAIAPRESAVGWLFETTRRLALKARTAAARRKKHQAKAITPQAPLDPLDELTFAEVRAMVAEELSRLPDHLRVPLVLCYWEGITVATAADRLGCSVSAVKRRLSAGREQLGVRLTRRGFTAAAVLSALTALQATARAVAPAGLVAFLSACKPGTTLSVGAATLVQGSTAPAIKCTVAASVMLTIGFGLVLGLGSTTEPAPPTMPQKLVAPPCVRTDAHGDALPPGAIVRFGTVRFRHGGQLHSIAYSPDGKKIASGGYGRIMLWEAKTGKPIASLAKWKEAGGQGNKTLDHGHTFGLAFLPDGKTLVSAGSPSHDRTKGHLLFWDINDRKCTSSIEHAGPHGTHWMRAVAVSPNGKLIAAGTDSGHVFLIDSATQKTVTSAKFESVGGLSFSPDGKTLAVASFEGTVLLNVATGKETRRLDTGQGTRQIVFAPDGKSIWVGRDGGDPPFRKDRRPSILAKWDLTTYTMKQYFETAPGAVFSLALSPDGQTLACGGKSFGPLLWDIATGKSTDLALVSRLRPWVQSLAFAPDGKTLAVVDTHGRVRIWEVATRRELHLYDTHSSGVIQAAMSPDQKHIATASVDSTVRIWDVATARQIRSWTADTKQSVFTVRYTPDGRSLLTSGWDGTVRLWDAATAKEVRRFREAEVFARSAMSPDGKLVAASGKDGRTIVLYETASGRIVRECTGHVSYLMHLAFSPDGRRLVSSADMHGEGPGKHFDDLSVRVWDVATGKQLHKFDAGRPSGNGAISPDRRVVAASASDSESTVAVLRFWDVLNGKELTDRRVKGIEAFAFSPDGRYLALARQGIQLMEVASGGIVQTLECEPAEVYNLTFVPGGRLLSAHGDGTAILWDLNGPSLKGPTSEKLWDELASHDATVAHRAARAMIAEPTATVTTLREKLKPVPKPAGVRSAMALITELDDETFTVREAASQELARRVEAEHAELTTALERSPSAEVRQRLRGILRSAPAPWPRLSAEELRVVRAVGILEAIATREARQWLKKLADGNPYALLTREARAACTRLEG
jgi:RNA polymerase sigma factor (sigma-70 family)